MKKFSLAFCQGPDVMRQSELFDERRRFKYMPHGASNCPGIVVLPAGILIV